MKRYPVGGNFHQNKLAYSFTYRECVCVMKNVNFWISERPSYSLMFHQNTDTNAVSFVNSEVVCFWLPGQERIRGQRVSGSEESWQRLHPVVECGDDAMTLTVRRRRAVQLLLNRGEATVFPFYKHWRWCYYPWVEYGATLHGINAVGVLRLLV